jgi:hypothetical protein
MAVSGSIVFNNIFDSGTKATIPPKTFCEASTHLVETGELVPPGSYVAESSIKWMDGGAKIVISRLITGRGPDLMEKHRRLSARSSTNRRNIWVKLPHQLYF